MLFADKDMLLLQEQGGDGKAGSMGRGQGGLTKVWVEGMLLGFAEYQDQAEALFPVTSSPSP